MSATFCLLHEIASCSKRFKADSDKRKERVVRNTRFEPATSVGMRYFSSIGSWAMKLPLAILLGAGMYLLTVNLVLLPHLPTALATEAQPHTDWSFFVTTADRTTAYNLGCNQGHYDASFSPPPIALWFWILGYRTLRAQG
jgi:hypothetical protein